METIDKNGVIHKILCYECNKEYIGKTEKELRKRITEHTKMQDEGRCDALSAFHRHIQTTSHSIDWHRLTE